MLQFVLAFCAGLLTFLNPCVLPLLPMLGAAALARHPLGPLAMVLGMMLTFTVAGIGIARLTSLTGIPPDDVAVVAGWVMMGFGLTMLLPQAQFGFARVTGATATGSTRLVGQAEGRGLGSEAIGGAMLGLAWSPCIGPTLGAAIGFAAEGRNLGQALGTMAAFAAGAAAIMLILSYGARGIIARRKAAVAVIAPRARKILGVGLVAAGAFVALHADHIAERWALENLPSWFSDLAVSV